MPPSSSASTSFETTAYDFAKRRMYVRLHSESVRGADVFVLQSHYKPINKAIMEQLIMIDALKARLGPFHYCGLPVARLLPSGQRSTAAAEPISCRLVRLTC